MTCCKGPGDNLSSVWAFCHRSSSPPPWRDNVRVDSLGAPRGFLLLLLLTDYCLLCSLGCGVQVTASRYLPRASASLIVQIFKGQKRALLPTGLRMLAEGLVACATSDGDTSKTGEGRARAHIRECLFLPIWRLGCRVLKSRGVVGEDSDDSYFVGSDVERCADSAAFLKPHCLGWQVQTVNGLTPSCSLQ